MIRVPVEAIEAGAKALENEHRIGNLEKSLSVLEAAMPAIREALAQKIEELIGDGRFTDEGLRHAARIVRDV